MAQSLLHTFLVIKPDQRVATEKADSHLYERLDRDYAGFTGCELVSVYPFEESWSSWEIHPNGDEVVVLLSGQVELVLERSRGNQSVTLSRQGEFAVVPQNTWHTVKMNTPSTLLFITPGEGTLSKPSQLT